MQRVILIAAVCTSAQDVANLNKPHIVFALTDDMGFADAGWTEGGGTMVTPFLDSLAQSGVILQHYHTEPVCSPTRGSIMTGMYPHKVCLQQSVVKSCDSKVFPDVPTLGDRLKKLGYTTHFFGKVGIFESSPLRCPYVSCYLCLFFHHMYCFLAFDGN
jgi:arylsulfatase A-like enzyme